MIVSHARRFIFFHNPKCAGMSFRDTLKPYHDDARSFWGLYPVPYFKNGLDHSHLRLWELHALYPRLFACAQDYASVIFVRHPYGRFLAALNEHFKKFQPQIDLWGLPPERKVAVMEQFLDKVLNIARITTDWRFVHFSPQIWFLQLAGQTIPRHILPMDPAGQFTGTALAAMGLPPLAVDWINKSPVDLTPVLQSPAILRFVHEFYADDFAFFRSHPALEQLAVQ